MDSTVIKLALAAGIMLMLFSSGIMDGVGGAAKGLGAVTGLLGDGVNAIDDLLF